MSSPAFRHLLISISIIVAGLALSPAVSAQADGQPTRSTAEGPEFQPGAPATVQLWQQGDPGTRMHLRGRVVSMAGTPVGGAEIQMWQTDGAGSYHDMRYRAVLHTAENGEFRITTAVPEQYYGAKHIHVIVSHPNYRPLTTRVLFKGDPHVGEHEQDLAIHLEEVRADGHMVMVGGVEFVLAPN